MRDFSEYSVLMLSSSEETVSGWLMSNQDRNFGSVYRSHPSSCMVRYLASSSGVKMGNSDGKSDGLSG